MRFVRFRAGGMIAYGEQVETRIHELAGAPWADAERTGRVVETEDVEILAPCAPGQVLAVGRNFASHLHGRPAPTEPGLFAKLPGSIIGPLRPIVPPPGAGEIHAEGEMVVVIGRRTSRADAAAARDAVFGVTAGNDVSERRWQRDDLQWLRAKGSDTFGPLGPAIETDVDYGDLLIETRVNGETVQSERSRDLIFPVEEIVAWASRFVTLEPGDVIYTGTPGDTASIASGDVVEVEVERVGTLKNSVA